MAGHATIAETARALARIQDAIEAGHSASLQRLDASWIGAAVDILIGLAQREAETRGQRR